MTRKRWRRDNSAEVVPDVFMFLRAWGCNVYLLGGAGLDLVDAGFPLDAGRLASECRLLDPRGPQSMIATHCHLDHMGSMARLKSAFGSSVAAHRDDADVMEGSEPYTMFKLDPLRAVYYRLLRPLYPYEYVDVDVRLNDGDILGILGGLEVVHVPGHTSGSIALFCRERRVLFTGDIIRNEDNELEGPPPQFTPDLEAAFDGIERKILPLDFDVLLPGHGAPVTRGARESVDRLVRKWKERG